MFWLVFSFILFCTNVLQGRFRHFFVFCHWIIPCNFYRYQLSCERISRKYALGKEEKKKNEISKLTCGPIIVTCERSRFFLDTHIHTLDCYLTKILSTRVKHYSKRIHRQNFTFAMKIKLSVHRSSVERPLFSYMLSIFNNIDSLTILIYGTDGFIGAYDIHKITLTPFFFIFQHLAILFLFSFHVPYISVFFFCI